ncbi:MAG: hypothetical protein II477_06440 [Lachnospiraceae bacterium]|nr:hypothetical protein [Lachnospiraceae bacterium]MBQ3906029.1 hypothetical protein [Lachnospiraceae bacterium]
MEFLNALASYGIVLVCFAAAVVAAIFLGIFLRKRKNAKEALEQAQETAEAK